MDHILATHTAKPPQSNNKNTVNKTAAHLNKRKTIFSTSMKTAKHKWRWTQWLTIALRKSRVTSAVTMCLCLLVTPALSVSDQSNGIKPFEANFTVGNNFVTAASAKLSLTGSDENWIYSLTIIPSGIFKLSGKGRIEELSTLKFVNNELQTQSYNHRQLGDKKRDVGALFDWRSGFDQLTFQVFDRGRIKPVVFENAGLETLDTKLGELQAYKVRSYNDDGTRQRATTTWYAPSLDYVPVRIEQHKEGNLIARLSITSLTQ